MAITRTQVASYLHSQFVRLAAEVKQTAADDSPTGYGPDIDQAFRKLGVAYADLATATIDDLKDADLFALARYFALLRFAALVSTKVDQDAGFAMQSGRSGVFRSVMDLLKEAKAELVVLGYLPAEDGSGGAFALIDLNLDYLEPGAEGVLGGQLYLE